MKNGHRKHWAYDRRTRKWVNLRKVKLLDFFNGRYDLEPNGYAISRELMDSLRPMIEEWTAVYSQHHQN